MIRRFACASLALSAIAAPAAAQKAIAIDDIRAQVFLERAGRWSGDLTAGKTTLKNVARGGAEAGDSANAVLVTLVFSGPKNAEGSRTVARDMAQVTVKQEAGAAPRTLLLRAFGGLRFGEEGLAHRAVLLDDATCAPLEIEVKIGRSRKVEKLDFACDAPAVAEAEAAAPKESRGKRR